MLAAINSAEGDVKEIDDTRSEILYTLHLIISYPCMYVCVENVGKL